MAAGLFTSYITSTNDTPSKISFNAIRFTFVTSKNFSWVNACEQSYPISNPTLQSSRSYILLSIGLKCSQFLAVDLVGMWSSSAGIDVLVKATGIGILRLELYPLT